MATKTEEAPEGFPEKEETTEEFTEFLKKVMQQESDEEVYIVPKYEAKELLTPNRLTLIEKIRAERPYSMRDLARKVDRDIKNVSQDLEVLRKYDLIEYTEEGNRKIPELTADKIIIEPL